MSWMPKVLFLKQTASMRHWFVELGTDFSHMVGPVLMYTSVASDREVDNLSIIAASPYRKDSDRHRLVSWFNYFVGACSLTWRTSPHALLFIVAQPPYLPLIGYARNILYRQKYIVWIDDVYPDVLLRHKRLSEKGIITRMWKGLNRLMLSRAERVFTLGPCMAMVLSQYVTHSKIEIIPTWVDSEKIKPLAKEQNSFAIQYGQLGKLTVLYSGNLGYSHDLGTLVEAAKRLEGQPDIHFLIIGDGPGWSELNQAAEEMQNLTILPFQPEEVLPFSLTTGDVAVISLDKDMEGISMPSKTYYMMAAGCALLGLSRPPNDLQLVIEKHKCGLNIEPGDIDGVIRAILTFRDNYNLLTQCRNAARFAAEREFSREINVKRLFNSINASLSGHSAVEITTSRSKL